MSNLNNEPSNQFGEAVSDEIQMWKVNRRRTTEAKGWQKLIWFIWPSGFSEDFLEIDQPESIIVYGGHVYYIWTKWAVFIEDPP
jgi:hypothetical protein